MGLLAFDGSFLSTIFRLVRWCDFSEFYDVDKLSVDLRCHKKIKSTQNKQDYIGKATKQNRSVTTAGFDKVFAALLISLSR